MDSCDKQLHLERKLVGKPYPYGVDIDKPTAEPEKKVEKGQEKETEKEIGKESQEETDQEIDHKKN